MKKVGIIEIYILHQLLIRGNTEKKIAGLLYLSRMSDCKCILSFEERNRIICQVKKFIVRKKQITDL